MKNNLKNILEIKNLTDTTCDLYFYGDIVDSWLGSFDDTDQYPQAIKEFLDEAKDKDINIYVNSGGGSVFAGMAIYNMLKRHKGHKVVHVDGLAGSIASVIALAGDKIVIPKNAYFMIHKPWCTCAGNANDFREMANTLDKVEQGILNVYKDNLSSEILYDEVIEMVNNETWLTGEEASKYFANVEIVEPLQLVACTSDLYAKYNNTPSDISNALKIENTSLESEVEVEKVKEIENKTEKDMLLIELDLI